MTLEELQEIEALAKAPGVGEFIATARSNVFKLCAALREAWQQAKAEKAAATAENARLQARVAELEWVLAEWYLASDDYAVGAETAAHDRLNELAAECAAKQEALDAVS